MAINEQDAESYWGEVVRSPEYAKSLYESGPAHTAKRGETILCCAGLIPQWEGYAKVWAIMARKIGNDYVSVHRAVKRFLALHESEFCRVDTSVDCGFEAGIRWADLLGFVNEGRMRAYAVGGRDHYLYARVKQ